MSIVVRRTGQDMRATEIKPKRHSVDVVLGHLGEIGPAVAALRRESSRLAEWGEELARVKLRGGRIIAAGSEGSSHEADRFTAELAYHDARNGGDGKSFTTISAQSDQEGGSIAGQIAKQVRRGDIVVLFASRGIADDLREAAAAAKSAGAKVWALTGKESRELSQSVSEAIWINTDPPHAEEAHLVAVLTLCECFDESMRELTK
ncbi:SIS domain-containing protein [Paenarthrobacter sp. NPDC089989]|uniref:SIS domain-containing protein n=1 Tax=unclassified Paenarthrobacter TaxID=2634190 RepID=UPI00381B33A3